MLEIVAATLLAVSAAALLWAGRRQLTRRKGGEAEAAVGPDIMDFAVLFFGGSGVLAGGSLLLAAQLY